MVLEVTARDDEGKIFFKNQKTYFEIGVDTDRDMRYGAWQIKEVIDLTLPPLQTQKEQYLIHFEPETSAAKVEAKLWYYISGAKGSVVHEVSRDLEF